MVAVMMVSSIIALAILMLGRRNIGQLTVGNGPGMAVH
jgi:hypothetical protein